MLACKFRPTFSSPGRVIVIAVGIGAAALMINLYNQARRSDKMSEDIIQIAALGAAVVKASAGRTGYGEGDLVPLLRSENALPQGMRIGQDDILRSLWGGQVKVIGHGAQFELVFSGVPAARCGAVSAIHSGRNKPRLIGVSINGHAFTWPMALSALADACGREPAELRYLYE